MGVRPHAVGLGQGGAGAQVFASQWLGDQTHVAAHFAGGAIVSVRHDRVALAKGDAIGITLAASDLHLFDTRTGAAISHGGVMA